MASHLGYEEGKYGTESAYSMAMILELGRRNLPRRAGKGGIQGV